MIKKLVSLTAALVLALGGAQALPIMGLFDTAVTARAEDILTYGDYEYRVLDDGTVEIINYIGNDTEVNIPTIFNDKRVTKIGRSAFQCITDKSPSKIIIPNGVISIDDNAFGGCVDLTNITIPDSVIYIGNNAFQYCKNLKSIKFPEGINSIGQYSFHECYKLTEITIPDNVTIIKSNAFESCINLNSIKLPKNLKEIEFDAFKSCAKLNTIYIPQGVVSIGVGAFSHCEKLTTVNIPDSVKTIGACAFSCCKSLKNLSIPSNAEVGAIAFLETEWLSERQKEDPLVIINGILLDGNCCTGDIIIPESVSKIAGYAFNYTKNIKSITIPNSVKSIEQINFYNYATIVKCYTNSVAHQYAINNRIPYELLDAPKTVDLKTCTATLSKSSYTYTGSANKPTVTVKDGSTTLKSGTDYTVAYKNNTNAGTASVTITGKGSYTGTKTLSFKIIPGNVGGFKAASTSASAVKLTWNKVNGAAGYIVYQYNTSTSKWVRVAKTGNVNTYTVTGLKAGTNYKYAIKAYKTVSGTEYSSASYPTLTTSTKPAKVSFTAKSSAAKKITYSWSKVTGATNYIVYYRVKGASSWKSVKVANTVTARTITGLTSGKTYEVTVKAVRTTGGVTYNGAYDVKTVKVK